MVHVTTQLVALQPAFAGNDLAGKYTNGIITLTVCFGVYKK